MQAYFDAIDLAGLHLASSSSMSGGLQRSCGVDDAVRNLSFANWISPAQLP
jgi:hypothetical protein